MKGADPERVAALRSFVDAVRPALATLAGDAHAADGGFRERFAAWAEANGHDDRPLDEQFELAAGRYASLLGSRALTRAVDPDARAAAAVSTVTGSHVAASRSLFERFPDDQRVDEAVEELRERLAATGVDGARLGDHHQELVPDDERAADGQYYTPPRLVEAVVHWAVPGDADGPPRVLDPAAGSGRFTVAAYRRLADRYPGLDHRERLGRLVAVDVNRVPLRLTALNLARQAPEGRADGLDARHASFFDLAPGGGPGTDDELGTFDAVVGNPPYVRQEDLTPGKEHYRRHLRRFGGGGGTPYYDGDRAVGGKSDAYVYFVTHAAAFLRDGGRLGYVVPTKWMATDYGRSFQRFLFDHFRVAAVVGFDGRAFEDALVDACLLLLERCDDAAERAGTVTRFVRLEESMSVGAVLDAVAAGPDHLDAGEVAVEFRGGFRTVAMRQADVAAAESGKLAHLLTAPEAVVQLVEHPALVRLDELATVAYGNKTGANDFFFLDADDRAEWGVDGRFLAPAIKSLRDADGLAVTAETTERWLLDVHDYVRDVLADTDPDDPEARVEEALVRDGHDALAAYVAHGERAGYHERSTCASRAVWFDLGDLRRPPVLHPKFFDDRLVPLWNRDRLAPSNAVDCVDVADGVDETVLFGVLSSTVHRLLLECWGRVEGGGALQLMTYEMESLPTVDPASLTGDQREAVRAAVGRLLDGDEDARDDLDRVLLDVLGLDLGVGRLQAMQSAITRRRVRGGDEVSVPVERVDRAADDR